MKILLVGGLGYIGSTLVESLRTVSGNDHVTILDPLLYDVDPRFFHRAMSDDRFRFIKGDVSDMRLSWDLVKRHDCIVYMASLTLPATAQEPEEGIFINRTMAEMVGDCCTKLKKRMIFMSTCSNYGKADKPVDEDGDLLPVSMYARTKVDAEMYLKQNVPNVTILRCATAYGVGVGRTRWDVLFNNFVQKGASDGVIDLFQPNVYRPICHVHDLARAIIMFATMPEQCAHTTYNVGSDSQNYTKRDLAQIAAKATKANIDITEKDDDRDYMVDFNRIRKDMGFRPKHTPESAAPELLSELKKTSSIPFLAEKKK